jgi:lysophospholipid acyltransferase (LPLAT)-like uncharacterized protein
MRLLLALVVPPLIAGAARFVGGTLRVSVDGLEAITPLWRAGRPAIYIAWHGRILMMPWVHARLRRTHGAPAARVLASSSWDGEVVARYAARFGLAATRGSSSRGGVAALRGLLRTLRAGEDVAVVPDGPRGPSCRLGPGVAALAILSGAPVVPLAFAAHPAQRLRSWDAFLVPVPFARSAVVFGPPITVEPDADREQVRDQLEERLAEVTLRADRLVRS